jgi:adenylyltransferase/sulfurtransferase
MVDFTPDQIERYSRQIVIPEIGAAGQKKIRKASVLIVGSGGLGSPCAYYLTAAGVGKLGIIDKDFVDLSNLQRQILHSTEDLNHPKVNSAKKRLNKLNPDVEIVAIKEQLTSKNVLKLIEGYDIIIDCTDNFPARYLINDACLLANKPMVHGGVYRFEGQIFTILPKKSPCYRCLFSEPPPPETMPSCKDVGVLGAVPGVIGSLQAAEVVKYIIGKGDLLLGRILIFDALTANFREVKFRCNPNCRVCGEKPSITSLSEKY